MVRWWGGEGGGLVVMICGYVGRGDDMGRYDDACVCRTRCKW